MAILIDHTNQKLGVTDRTAPLILDAPGGLLVPTSNIGYESAGTIVFDPAINRMKYYTGTRWMIIGSTEGLSDKATKLTAEHFGSGSASSSTYLSANSSGVPEWRDPANDGFIRFIDGETITISSKLVFQGEISFSKNLNMASNIVQNITTGDDNDAVPRSYVDAALQEKVDSVAASLNSQYASLLSRYQTLIAAINGAPTPAPPNPPRRFNMNYTARTLGQNENPSILATFSKQQATSQNLGRNPASGSTFYCTFKQTVQTTSGKSVSYSTVSRWVLFNYNGSTATYASRGNL